MRTSILSCRCRHAYQDATHGPGLRVHNHLPAAPKSPASARCTVCGNTRPRPMEEK